MDLDASVTIGALSLASSGFELMAVGASGRTWRRRTAEGTYMHGRVLLGAVMEQEVLTVIVRCRGTSWTAAMNRATELFAAASAMSYTTTVVIEGRSTAYTCEVADIAPVSGDTIDKFRAMANMIEYQLTIPVHPGVL